ncbi:MAG: YihY/virulence factor BrkB family protein [Culicoidibacterales bacterium]
MNQIQQFFEKISRDQLGLLSAQIAYTLILALFPFFIVLVVLLGELNLDAADLLTLFGQFLPPETLTLLADIALQTSAQAGGLLSPLTFVAIISIATGMIPLLHAMNRLYDLTESRTYIRQYFTSFISTLMIMSAIIVTLIFFVIDVYLWQFFVSILPFLNDFEILFQVVRIIIPLLLFTSSLTVIYRILPTQRFSWRHSFLAALFSTLFWVIISLGFSFYVTNITQRYSQLYGGLAAVIALITWLYFTAYALLLGIECALTLQPKSRLHENHFLHVVDQSLLTLGNILTKFNHHRLKKKQ